MRKRTKSRKMEGGSENKIKPHVRGPSEKTKEGDRQTD